MGNQVDIYFGGNLRKIREARGMTQVEFALMCKISRAYYGRLERGEYSATVEICSRIAEALGLPLAALFEDMPC